MSEKLDIYGMTAEDHKNVYFIAKTALNYYNTGDANGFVEYIEFIFKTTNALYDVNPYSIYWRQIAIILLKNDEDLFDDIKVNLEVIMNASNLLSINN